MRGVLIVLSLIGVIVTILAAWPAPQPVSHVYFEGAPSGRAEIIAHGGGQGVRPPNTLAALDAAVEMGADVLEVDVQQTADGVLVLRHDDTLDRTTDLEGPVAARSLEEIREADAGANDVVPGRDFSGRGIGVPTLQEALSRHREARWILEIKPDTRDAADAMCRTVRDARMAKRVLVGSFHAGALKAFRTACPEVATSMHPGEVRSFVLAAHAGLSRFIDTPALALQIPTRAGGLDLMHPRVLAAARARGFRVQVWTINEPAEMAALLDKEVDGIITDFVALLREVVLSRSSTSQTEHRQVDRNSRNSALPE